jgi:site-specific DNA-cytosine methylase
MNRKYKKQSRKYQLVSPCKGNSKTSKTKSRGQLKTVIPWCLANTADKNGNWNGAYGRLTWDDVIPTVLTKPSPLRAGGRIIHPQLERFITVREAARLQSFPDNFFFRGKLDSKLRQVSK